MYVCILCVWLWLYTLIYVYYMCYYINVSIWYVWLYKCMYVSIQRFLSPDPLPVYTRTIWRDEVNTAVFYCSPENPKNLENPEENPDFSALLPFISRAILILSLWLCSWLEFKSQTRKSAAAFQMTRNVQLHYLQMVKCDGEVGEVGDSGAASLLYSTWRINHQCIRPSMNVACVYICSIIHNK